MSNKTQELIDKIKARVFASTTQGEMGGKTANLLIKEVIPELERLSQLVNEYQSCLPKKHPSQIICPDTIRGRFTMQELELERLQKESEKYKKALERLVELNKWVSGFEGEIGRDKIDRAWELARQALKTPEGV